MMNQFLWLLNKYYDSISAPYDSVLEEAGTPSCVPPNPPTPAAAVVGSSQCIWFMQAHSQRPQMLRPINVWYSSTLQFLHMH
jgi:hypothetical protein